MYWIGEMMSKSKKMAITQVFPLEFDLTAAY